jgi:hypothetical protein
MKKPEEEHIDELSDDEVHQKLIDRGFTSIDFERMEMRASSLLVNTRIQDALNRFKFDFSRVESPRK